MGWRGRIGVILPGDGTTDSEYIELMPRGVTCHMTRVNLAPGPYSLQHALDLATSPELEQAARTFRLIEPSSVALACSSASFIRGPGSDVDIARRLSVAAGGCPTTTTSTGMIEMLRSLGACRPGIVSPYEEHIRARLLAFLKAAGFSNVSVVTIPNVDRISELDLRAVYRSAMRFAAADVDVVFLSCTALRTEEVRKALTEDLGRVVLSANQVTVWHALKVAGIDCDHLAGGDGC